jgi:pre-mRNA-splicing factor ATP-dependent RNA helicase DHX15/PRP43
MVVLSIMTNIQSQDIAPTYYDLTTFAKGEIRTALQRTLDKVKRKQAMKGGR